jgi:hypothetical protein
MAAARKSWFVRSGRNMQGPMSSAELQQMARFGVIGPETEVSQSETGPWRPARQVKGLVFREPELPPLGKPSPFDSFADPVGPAAPRDDGILLEETRPAEQPESEPEIAFEQAPPPTAATPEISIPSFTSSVTDLLTGRTRSASQYPEYSALRAYGWLFRIAGFLLIGLGVLAFVAAMVSLFWVQEGFRGQVLALGAAALINGFLLGFLLLIPGDAIHAFVDLVQDARRQRIAAERSTILLEIILSRQPQQDAVTEGAPG